MSVTYVARTKRDVMKSVDNTGRDVFDEVTLVCGHLAAGAPMLSNPPRYWCEDCRGFRGVKGSKKKAA